MNFLFTKIEEEDIGNIWFQQDGATWHTGEATLDILRPVFEDRIISRRADVVWPARSCDLKPLDYYLWGTVKDKCYADKLETIDALKDNIREAIGEIQLHTIDNMLKNWTNRIGYEWHDAFDTYSWALCRSISERFINNFGVSKFSQREHNVWQKI